MRVNDYFCRRQAKTDVGHGMAVNHGASAPAYLGTVRRLYFTTLRRLGVAVVIARCARSTKLIDAGPG